MAHAETEHVYRGNLEKLLRKVNEERGLDLSQYRRPYIERRVAARLRTLNLHSYRQYAAYIDEHPDEYGQLLDVLTINVTDFFRDRTVYEVFSTQVLPELLESKLARRQSMIRVWSAGCATGEEAYSVAMVLMEALDENSHRVLVNVWGTDIDPNALAVAKRGVYPVSELRHIPHRYQVKYVKVEGDTFSIAPQVASRVRFHSLNLFADKPISVSDVIFCRNVFIYFDRTQQERILERFWTSLTRGGYLVLGRSEKLAPGVSHRYELVNGKERIYRKPSAL